MAMQKITIGTVLAIAMMGMVASGLGVLVATRVISNTGKLKAIGVGVYWDGSCINVVSSVDWGSLDPGVTRTVSIYVKNEGTMALVLNLKVENWSPLSASNYMALSWNRENYVLSAGSVVQANVTLSISSSISGISSFSFNIVISGTEQT